MVSFEALAAHGRGEVYAVGWAGEHRSSKRRSRSVDDAPTGHSPSTTPGSGRRRDEQHQEHTATATDRGATAGIVAPRWRWDRVIAAAAEPERHDVHRDLARRHLAAGVGRKDRDAHRATARNYRIVGGASVVGGAVLGTLAVLRYLHSDATESKRSTPAITASAGSEHLYVGAGAVLTARTRSMRSTYAANRAGHWTYRSSPPR